MFEVIIALFFFKALSFGEGLGGVRNIAPMFEDIAALFEVIVALFFFKALSLGEGLGGVRGIVALFVVIAALFGGNDCLCSVEIWNI